jgi:hypothetical protein
MNAQDILQQFESTNTWQRKGVRALHKPLIQLEQWPLHFHCVNSANEAFA